MSDQSDTSSFNEEWEPINDSSQELKQEMDKLREEMKAMKMEMDKKDRQIAKQKMKMENKIEKFWENYEEMEKNARDLFEKDLMIKRMNSEIDELHETNVAKDMENEELFSKVEAMESNMDKLREEMKVMKMEMEEKDAEIAEKNTELLRKNDENKKKEGEVNTLRELKESQYMEIKDLQEQELPISLEGWMKVEMENMNVSSANLKKKIVELYKKITETELARAEAATLSNRKKTTKCLREMEEACCQFSRDLLKNNAKCMAQITKLLKRMETLSAANENLSIDCFLGEFTTMEIEEMPLIRLGAETLPLRTIIIRKAKEVGCYEILYKSDNGKERISSPWIPDSVVRGGWSYRIEKNVLIHAQHQHGFSDAGLRLGTATGFYRVLQICHTVAHIIGILLPSTYLFSEF